MIRKKDIERLINEYTKEYVLNITERDRMSLSNLEFLKKCELPSMEKELKKSIEEDGGYWSVFCAHRINVIKEVISELDLSPQQVNGTKKIIENEFEALDKRGWEYAFRNEKDYNLFLELLTNYFENRPYEIPKQPIKLKRDTKTKIAKVFNPIHKELSNCDKLKEDIEYFKIIRVLNHFKNLSDIDIYKHITR